MGERGKSRGTSGCGQVSVKGEDLEGGEGGESFEGLRYQLLAGAVQDYEHLERTR